MIKKEINKRKVKIRHFFEPIFGFQVTLFVGTREEVTKYLRNSHKKNCSNKIPHEYHSNIPPEVQGFYTRIQSEDYEENIVWVNECSYEGHSIIAHETFHLTAYLLDSVGVKFDVDNHETHAYMYTYWIKTLTLAFNDMVRKDEDTVS